MIVAYPNRMAENRTIAVPAGPSVCEKASMVRAVPVRPSSQSPLDSTTNAVTEQVMIVSMNTSSMASSP
jgi:hypothetical protein